MGLVEIFQIKESPEGDWNIDLYSHCLKMSRSFKLKNPRKGTETVRKKKKKKLLLLRFQIKESPEGDWNFC